MIYRLVLAVAVMTALVGATAPALSTARADAASGAMERQLDELGAELTTLVETDDATANGDARRAVEIRLPRGPTRMPASVTCSSRSGLVSAS
nr:hypothetical protein [Haloarcula sp. CBA1131]